MSNPAHSIATALAEHIPAHWAAIGGVIGQRYTPEPFPMQQSITSRRSIMKTLFAAAAIALAASAPAQAWVVTEKTSPMDDSKTVRMLASSNESIPSRFGLGSDRINLRIRCEENSTEMYFQFSGHHMADIQGYGKVRMRVDEGDVFSRSMRVSTSNKALGLWSGSGIGTIKRFFGGDTLVVQATPYGESQITVTFDLTGIEEEIQPLREACNW